MIHSGRDQICKNFDCPCMDLSLNFTVPNFPPVIDVKIQRTDVNHLKRNYDDLEEAINHLHNINVFT